MAVIEFKNVSKHFNIYKNQSHSLKEKFLNKILHRDSTEVTKFDVLKNASFTVDKGETVGIIGENGTGKSTSLKLVANIIRPNSGEIFVKGKISSLLEVGVGFQPDMTGRENVYLYGSILGLSKKQIDERYDEIVKFAELENFMDTPVKNYSSGMYMRLGFSVAVTVDPDILLVDEVLAVGDANFQKKCLNKIQSFKEQGKTILFVSHDMSSVRRICDRCIFIKKGGEVIQGPTDRMIGLYMKLLYAKSKDNIDENKEKNQDKLTDFDFTLHEAPEFIDGNREGNKKLEITKVYFSDNAGVPRNFFGTEENIKVNVEFKRNSDVKAAVAAFEIFTEEGFKLIYHDCKQDGMLITDMKDTNMISFSLQNELLLKSKYYFSIGLLDEDLNEIYDFRHKHYWFTIHEGNIKEDGKVKINCDWML